LDWNSALEVLAQWTTSNPQNLHTYTRVSEEAPVDTGSLREGGRKQQPGSPIYNNPMTAKVAHERVAEIA
jgi:hypothetical protein